MLGLCGELNVYSFIFPDCHPAQLLPARGLFVIRQARSLDVFKGHGTDNINHHKYIPANSLAADTGCMLSDMQSMLSKVALYNTMV